MINKSNQLSEQQSNFIKSANNVTKSLYDLLIKWQELDANDEELACEEYPFDESLDDMWANVSHWEEQLLNKFKKTNDFHPTITVGDMKKILENADDEDQIVIWDERQQWWLNIASVEFPNKEDTYTIILNPKDNFDTRQI